MWFRMKKSELWFDICVHDRSGATTNVNCGGRGSDGGDGGGDKQKEAVEPICRFGPPSQSLFRESDTWR